MSGRITGLNNAQTQRAYEIQYKGGIEGMITYGIVGAIGCTVAHFTWPLFQRQTLALKGFLTSSAGVAGLVIGADTHLIRYEHHLRVKENELRRMARNDLAREGKIATETEIRRWREKYDKNLQEAELANAARQAREQGEKRIEA